MFFAPFYLHLLIWIVIEVVTDSVIVTLLILAHLKRNT